MYILPCIRAHTCLKIQVRGDHKGANNLYISALRSDPSYSKTLLDQGKARGGMSCENAMKVLLVFNSTYAPAAWELGLIYHARGEHAQASMWFQRAVNSDANLAEELFALARKHERDGRVEECRNAYELVLAAAPWHVGCAWRLAAVKEDLLRNADAADVLFERALQRENQDVTTHANGFTAGSDNVFFEIQRPASRQDYSADMHQFTQGDNVVKSCIPGRTCINGCTSQKQNACIRDELGVCQSWKSALMELIERGSKREARGDAAGAVRAYRLVLKYGKHDKSIEGDALRRCAVTLHLHLRDYDAAEECEYTYTYTYIHTRDYVSYAPSSSPDSNTHKPCHASTKKKTDSRVCVHSIRAGIRD
jgi:tetratricopeptide (TPR) repeat protein